MVQYNLILYIYKLEILVILFKIIKVSIKMHEYNISKDYYDGFNLILSLNSLARFFIMSLFLFYIALKYN